MSRIFYTSQGKIVKNIEKFTDTTNDSLNLKGNLSMDGTIKATKYLLPDGSQLSSGQSSFPSNITFDSQGNMTINGNLSVNGTIVMNGKTYTLQDQQSTTSAMTIAAAAIAA
jgi:hypothetical protein